MARTKRSKDAVVRALAALRRHGFVDWLRRYIPTGNLGAGPQVQQTSNAYRLALPPAAERLLGRALIRVVLGERRAFALRGPEDSGAHAGQDDPALRASVSGHVDRRRQRSRQGGAAADRRRVSLGDSAQLAAAGPAVTCSSRLSARITLIIVSKLGFPSPESDL